MKSLIAIIIFFVILITIRPKNPYPEKHPHFDYISRGDWRTYFGVHPTGCGHPINRVRNNLKSLGQAVAMYYTDGLSISYPADPNDFEFDLYDFKLRHLINSDKELPENWQIPKTWKKFNQSKSPFAFIRSAKEDYTYSSEKALFIIKPNFQPNLPRKPCLSSNRTFNQTHIVE